MVLCARERLYEGETLAEHSIRQPDPFLEIRVHEANIAPGLTGVCAGYEAGEWRADHCARHLTEWLPEFALTQSERDSVGPHNAVSIVAKAAQTVYTSRKYDRRGEIGELLLHVLLRQVFDTVPAVSKWYFKDAANDTVKGFDAVHVIASAGGLELWLGEAKFYDDISRAIADVVDEMQKHTGRDYLRGEFAAITRKIEDGWPHSDRLKRLLHPNTSLDEIFDAVCIPALLSYNSPTVAAHSEVSEAYEAAFRGEVERHRDAFAQRTLPNVRVHLFLFPLGSKRTLMDCFDRRLRLCQGLA